MPESAMEGTILAKLIAMAAPVCRKAQSLLPPRGRGAPPEYEPWQIAVLICVAVAAKRKSKSAQYRYLDERRDALTRELELGRFPARSTYFERYKHANVLLGVAVECEGLAASARGLINPKVLAVDKSLIRARGKVHHQRHRINGTPPPRGADPEASWGYSAHHGWVYGYGYEVLVSASPGNVVYPLAVSLSPASVHESRTVRAKLEHLPPAARYLLGDSAYDINACAEGFEYSASGEPTGRHWVCPLIARAGKPRVGRMVHRGKRERSRQRRRKRLAFYESKLGKRIYRQRGRTIEPFNEWFKSKFELKDSAWHKGLANNATQVTAAILIYQLLIRMLHRSHRADGPPNGAIQCLLDAM